MSAQLVPIVERVDDGDTSDPSLTLAELERRHVLRPLARADGDRKQAADALGLDLSTLYRKLKRWEDGA